MPTQAPVDNHKMIPAESDVRPYLNGSETCKFLTHHRASRWVINFGDRAEGQARKYRETWAMVEGQVKPERDDSLNRAPLREQWWILRPQPNCLYAAIKVERAHRIALEQALHARFRRSTDLVSTKTRKVFTYDDDGHLGTFGSAFHWWWVRHLCPHC